MKFFLRKFFFKRALDLVVSVALLFILSPLFIFLVFAGVWNFQGKPFFFQIRPGKNQKMFLLFKFKTMRDLKDSNGNLLSDAERLTRWGKFLRSTSLDELPQLWNVLKGEMSLVGPRPLLPEYLPLYTKIEKIRHQLKPGMTGWAQVNGRNATTWEARLAEDVWYVENFSLSLDFHILMLTIRKVLKRDGIMSTENLTMLPLTQYRNQKEDQINV